MLVRHYHVDQPRKIYEFDLLPNAGVELEPEIAKPSRASLNVPPLKAAFT